MKIENKDILPKIICLKKEIKKKKSVLTFFLLFLGYSHNSYFCLEIMRFFMTFEGWAIDLNENYLGEIFIDRIFK